MQPLSIMIKPVSGACNMRCRYCFYMDVMSRRKTGLHSAMTLDMLETIVRRAFRYADGLVTFAFQGGEPTLAGLPFYEALVRFQRIYNTRGLSVTNSLQTNGYALTDDMIAFFARERFLLGVSVDGTPGLHDALRLDASGRPTCDRVMLNLTRLAEAGVDYNVLCVINNAVAERPGEVFQALAPHRFLQFIACLDDLDGTRTPWSLTSEEYLGFLKKTFDLYQAAYWAGKPVSVRNFDNYIGILMGRPPENCAMGGQCGQYFLIESDGGVYPCDFYVLDEWKLGNIAETPFNRLARSPVEGRFRAASQPVPQRCRACEWYALCRNGCRRERDPSTGINRWCECFRRFFEYGYPAMAEMARDIQTRRR